MIKCNVKKPTFWMTKGLPGCGKSTWAKKKIEEHGNTGIVRINNDELRAMIHAGKWSPGNEKFIDATRDALIKLAFEREHSVIVDNTHLSPIYEPKYREMAEREGYEFELIDFTTGKLAVSLEECLRRDQNRPNYVGEKVIRRMYRQYLYKPEPRPESDPNLPWVVICDLDGTMALFNGRGPFDEHKVGEDLVNHPVRSTVDFLMNGADLGVIFCSGRTDGCREATEAWLRDKAEIPVNNASSFLFMRKAGDQRSDAIVKREIYEQQIRGKFNVHCVFDDRQSVVDLWRSLGLSCFQVADGDF